MIGFDETARNALEVEGDRFTGTVAEPIFGREAKLQRCRAAQRVSDLRQDETLVVGDGANDLAMIGAPASASPFTPSRGGRSRGRRIDHGDLTALLYAQGYRREEFVDALDKGRPQAAPVSRRRLLDRSATNA